MNEGMCMPLSDYNYYRLMTTDKNGNTIASWVDIWLKAIGF